MKDIEKMEVGGGGRGNDVVLYDRVVKSGWVLRDGLYALMEPIVKFFLSLQNVLAILGSSSIALLKRIIFSSQSPATHRRHPYGIDTHRIASLLFTVSLSVSFVPLNWGVDSFR